MKKYLVVHHETLQRKQNYYFTMKYSINAKKYIHLVTYNLYYLQYLTTLGAIPVNEASLT